MIVVDASAVPDFPTGTRTRLRGLYGAYARSSAPAPVEIWLARGSTLMDGVDLPDGGAVTVRQVARPGGPLRRAARAWFPRHGSKTATLWHSETIPPLGPRGRPGLLTLHDLRWHRQRADAGGSAIGHLLRHRAATRWLPGVLEKLDGVVTVSAATRAEIHRVLGVPHRKIHLVENAAFSAAEVDLDPESCTTLLQRLGILEPYILSVGHLERRKGLDLVLGALARAKPETATATVQYVLVGDGPDRGRLERMSQDLQLRPRVRFLGRRNDQSVRALMQRCLALVFPSRIEGFGFPVFEALGRGCPVLSTPLPCLEDVHQGGLIRSDPDAQLWARKIHWIFHHRDELREEARAQRRSLSASTWERSAQQLAKVYTEVLENRAR